MTDAAERIADIIEKHGARYPHTVMVRYRYRLRPDVIAHLTLPRTLTAREVQRLTDFMRTLVTPRAPRLGKPRPINAPASAEVAEAAPENPCGGGGA